MIGIPQDFQEQNVRYRLASITVKSTNRHKECEIETVFTSKQCPENKNSFSHLKGYMRETLFGLT